MVQGNTPCVKRTLVFNQTGRRHTSRSRVCLCDTRTQDKNRTRKLSKDKDEIKREKQHVKTTEPKSEKIIKSKVGRYEKDVKDTKRVKPKERKI